MSNLDRLNRAVVTLLAALLIAAGGYGPVRSTDPGDVVGNRDQDAPLLLESVRDFFAENRWVWWALAALSLLLAWLGWRWLKLQLTPTPSLTTLHIDPGEAGRTELPTAAVADAVARDLQDDPDIRSARVRMVGDVRSPGLDVRVGVADTAEPLEVRRRIETDILPRARQALERPDLYAVVRLRLGDPTARSLE